MAYVSSSINYYRINANNTAIAQSPSGNGNPTEEITSPLASPGTFNTYSTAGGLFTITGTSTNFNLFAVNQYLYYTDASGNYVLVGQIATIAGNGLSLTLTTARVNLPTASSVLSAAYSLITNNESIYMRIATGAFGNPPNGMLIPDFGLGNWRIGDGLTGENNTNQSALERVSNVGNPLSNATVVENVPFTFVTMNQFQPVASTSQFVPTAYFPNTGSFPSYIWIEVTPQIGSSTSLSAQTLYRFTTQENTPSIEIFVSTASSKLSDAGYNNLATSSGPNQNS
jgi:hypothetical protein